MTRKESSDMQDDISYEGAIKLGVDPDELEDVPVEVPMANSTDSQERLEELEYEEVNLDDPDLDPLEWSVRKVIPIPKKYYWETENYQLPNKVKLWHYSIFGLGKALRMAERTGEFVANIMGINSSRYDYVTSTMTDEEWKTARRNAEEQRMRRAAYLIEKGNSDVPGEISVV